MEEIIQVLDCDYIMVNGLPTIRIFGKNKNNQTVCGFYKNFLPYFYIQIKDNFETKLKEFLNEKFSELVVDFIKTEKYLPIGFQKTKTNIIKLVLKDPSQVPGIREELKELEFVIDVFEADILFKYRFIIDKNLAGMKWIKISGRPSQTSVVKSDKKIEIENIENVDDEENVQFKYMSVDIENAFKEGDTPNSKRDSIIAIGLAFHPSFNGHKSMVLFSKHVKRKNNDIVTTENEKKMLEEFTKIIDSFNPDFIIGYNINNYDLPFLSDRLGECRVTKLLGRCNQKPIISKKISNAYKNYIVGRITADVYSLIKEAVGKGQLRLKRYGLSDVSKELLGEEKIDIAHSEIPKYWNGTEEQLQKLIEYTKKDAELALKLLLEKQMLDKFIELSKVSGTLLQDVLDGGEATRVENLLLKEFNKLDFIVPCKPSSKEIVKRITERETKGLKGALVLEPETGLHTTPIVYLDFKSMYPSIFISYNICPTTLILNNENLEQVKTPADTKFVSVNVREGILPKIVKYMIKERDRVIKQMKETQKESERRILDAKQYALKIMANAFYGYTGYTRARLYLLDVANAITGCGRFLIQKTKEIVESNKKFKVVYGDTDSIMVKLDTIGLDESFKIGEEIEKNINEELGEIVRMKIESIFKTLLILAKKRYAGLSYEKNNGEWKEKIIMKGIETVRRDWCDLVSETLYKVLEIILKEQNPKEAFDYMRNIITKLERNEIPIDKLIITKSISKSLRDYKGIQPHIELVKKLRKRTPSTAPGVGDRVGFVIVKGLQLMSDRAEDPEYIRQHNLQIDSKYYIESQILPPLERVFEVIGIKKGELIGNGKQLLLADIIRNNVTNEPLSNITGFVCNKCNKFYRRAELIGKCSECGGEILFADNHLRSRAVVI